MINGRTRAIPSTGRSVSVRKRDNYDASTYYRAILTAVPRMTAASAASIERLYPNVDALISAWRTCDGTENARQRMLANIEISGAGAKRTRNGKLYKLGIVRSKLLYTLLGAGIENNLNSIHDHEDDDDEDDIDDDPSISIDDNDDEILDLTIHQQLNQLRRIHQRSNKILSIDDDEEES